VSGPFDGDEVADRLTSNTGKIITDTPLGSGRGGGKQKHAIAANGCSRLAFVHPDGTDGSCQVIPKPPNRNRAHHRVVKL